MKRFGILALCLVLGLSASPVSANPLKKLWPFGKKDPPTLKSRMASGPLGKSTGPTKGFGAKSVFNKIGKSTDAVMTKTKDTMKGMSQIGKKLNPFHTKTKNAGGKNPFWPAGFSKKKPNNPNTVKEFMSLPRPDF